MALPELSLADLGWDDLVGLARRRIAAVTRGEWTLHAPVDAGMTMVELFAWLLEQRVFWLDQVPDAVPKVEPYASGANRPYVVFGQRYVPDTSGQPYKKRGTASWYGKKFHGNSTSIGEAYDMYSMTAAHTTLPLPSYARVTSLVNGKTVVVRVNDRGPFHSDRIMDLSYVAAYKLGIIGPGSGQVIVEAIPPDEIRRLASQGAPAAAPPEPASATGSAPVSAPVAATSKACSPRRPAASMSR